MVTISLRLKPPPVGWQAVQVCSTVQATATPKDATYGPPKTADTKKARNAPSRLGKPAANPDLRFFSGVYTVKSVLKGQAMREKIKKIRSYIDDNKLVAFGLTITIPYLLWAANLVFFKEYSKFKALGLNELGDLLAGIFGPLAFLWLVIGYMQQGRELRFQIEELKNSVKYQGELADAAWAQINDSRKQIKRNARPIFAIENVSSSGGPHGLVLSISFSNHGHTARNVQFIIDRSIKIDPENLYSVTPNSTYKILVKPLIESDLVGQTIKVTYIDSMDSNGVMFWEIKKSNADLYYIDIMDNAFGRRPPSLGGLL